jgi:hypothetical protein
MDETVLTFVLLAVGGLAPLFLQLLARLRTPKTIVEPTPRG